MTKAGKLREWAGTVSGGPLPLEDPRIITTETLPFWTEVEIRARHNFILEIKVEKREVWPVGFDLPLKYLVISTANTFL